MLTFEFKIEIKPSDIKRFWSKVRKTKKCWIWTGGQTGKGYKIGKGYGLFRLRAMSIRAHRFAWMITHGKFIPDGILVLHHCDNPPCVRPRHLFLGDKTDNALDMVAKGRSNGPSGECNGQSKLTDASVRIIRGQHMSGMSYYALARIWKVSEGTIKNLVIRRTWKHVR